MGLAAYVPPVSEPPLLICRLARAVRQAEVHPDQLGPWAMKARHPEGGSPGAGGARLHDQCASRSFFFGEGSSAVIRGNLESGKDCSDV